MKKFLSLTVLGVSLVSLAACGNSSSKTETKGSLDNEASKILTVKHGNIRQNFDKITRIKPAIPIKIPFLVITFSQI